MPHTSHRNMYIPRTQDREVKVAILEGTVHYRVDFIDRGVIIGHWPIDKAGLDDLINNWCTNGKRPQ